MPAALLYLNQANRSAPIIQAAAPSIDAGVIDPTTTTMTMNPHHKRSTRGD